MSNDGLRFEHGVQSPEERDLPAESSSRGRVHRRLFAAMVLAALLVVAAALVFAKIFGAERIPELTVATLDEAEQRWQLAGPQNYDIDIELRGAQPGSVHAQIRGGEVTALSRDGRTPKPHTWRYWSVPGMLETLERALVMAEDPVHEMGASEGTQWQLRCEFDPQFGYPRRYHRFVSAGGPEVYWRVTRFEPK